MNLKYALYDTPVPGGRKNKSHKHARIISNGTVDMEMVCELVSQSSSFSSADVKGILAALMQWMGIYLTGGSKLKLDGFGLFFPTLRSRTFTDDEGKERVRVQIDSVGFRCASRLKKRLRGAILEEVKRPRVNRNDSESRDRILLHIQSQGYINAYDTMVLNGYNRHAALADLKILMEENKIRRIGKSRQTVYICK